MWIGKKIEDILREEDIEGLIEAGAPEDEYDSEAEVISIALAQLPQHQRTEAAITSLIATIWKESFNRSEEEINQCMSAFRRMGDRFLKSLGSDD